MSGLIELAIELPRMLCALGTHGQGAVVATVKEFVDFWIENSVHADEQLTARRGRGTIQKLADRLLAAAEGEGFTKAQVETEIGDVFAYIRSRIDAENVGETARWRLNGQ